MWELQNGDEFKFLTSEGDESLEFSISGPWWHGHCVLSLISVDVKEIKGKGRSKKLKSSMMIMESKFERPNGSPCYYLSCSRILLFVTNIFLLNKCFKGDNCLLSVLVLGRNFSSSKRRNWCSFGFRITSFDRY